MKYLLKDDVLNMDREELWKKIRGIQMKLQYSINQHNSKKSFIRHYNLRIAKVKRTLEYLLEHPYSMDSSVRKRKLRK